MTIITYMCGNCSRLHTFNPYDNNNEFLCPKCGMKMAYVCTEEIDPNSQKVIKRYTEADRKQKNPSRSTTNEYAKPTVECPYCHSTNTKKISGASKAGSVALFGIFALGKMSKQWRCNKCGSEF